MTIELTFTISTNGIRGLYFMCQSDRCDLGRVISHPLWYPFSKFGRNCPPRSLINIYDGPLYRETN